MAPIAVPTTKLPSQCSCSALTADMSGIVAAVKRDMFGATYLSMNSLVIHTEQTLQDGAILALIVI